MRGALVGSVWAVIVSPFVLLGCLAFSKPDSEKSYVPVDTLEIGTDHYFTRDFDFSGNGKKDTRIEYYKKNHLWDAVQIYQKDWLGNFESDGPPTSINSNNSFFELSARINGDMDYDLIEFKPKSTIIYERK